MKFLHNFNYYNLDTFYLKALIIITYKYYHLQFLFYSLNHSIFNFHYILMDNEHFYNTLINIFNI